MTKSFGFLDLLVGLAIPAMIFLICGFKAMAAEQEDLSVLSRWMRWTDAPNMLYHHLSDQAFQYLDERASKVALLKTEGQWLKRQEAVHKTLMEIVGPFPEKTPLNPQVVGVIEKDGYRVEKVIYESMPNFYVTACLFIPNELEGKTPAILYPSGHTAVGFRTEAYQTSIINLVKKGFIVLAYDPIGQGERLQYFDPEKGVSRIGGPTTEHSYVGAQCFISGSSFARYRIWDGIRSVDYLLTRDEVDAERIGITGRSGGGTMSSYVAAFDDRILATAPECYITSFKRLLESIGPQDAEQNFYHGIANHIDHADLLEVRAPKPALMITTTRDFFSIQGARETAAEIEKAYKVFGKEENFGMVEDDAGHQSTVKNREAMYAFFQKHLELPGSSDDEEVEILTPEQLKVTETGQVSTSLGGETVFSINRSETQRLLDELEKLRKNTSKNLRFVKYMAERLSGYVPPDPSPRAAFIGRYQRDGYSIEKYMLDGEGEYVIPFLLISPNEGEKKPAIIYIHPGGKAVFSTSTGLDRSSTSSDHSSLGLDRQIQAIEGLVKNGFAVLVPDLIWTGETGPGGFKGDAYIGNVSFNVWFESILIGRSIAGIQAGDLVRCVRYLESRKDIDFRNISAIAWKEMCPTLLHAATFDDAIRKVALIEPVSSYRSIVMNRYYEPRLIPATVAGALTAYDLPNLAACLAPRELLMVNVTDQNGDQASPDLIEEELGIVRSAYSDAKEKLEIRSWKAEQTIDEVFSSWLKR